MFLYSLFIVNESVVLRGHVTNRKEKGSKGGKFFYKIQKLNPNPIFKQCREKALGKLHVAIAE